jgi:hypothetical protein
MKMRFKSDFSTPEKRKEFAQLLTNILEAANVKIVLHNQNVPYQLDHTDAFRFVLDLGNDWWISFDLKEKSVVDITHRYYAPKNGLDSEDRFCAWLSYRYGGVVIKEGN